MYASDAADLLLNDFNEKLCICNLRKWERSSFLDYKEKYLTIYDSYLLTLLQHRLLLPEVIKFLRNQFANVRFRKDGHNSVR
jgi:hypothetical protein